MTQRVTIAEFAALFEKWNRSINLSAARTRPELDEQIADSLAVIPHIERLAPRRLVDVGSGGGLPSVVIAISCPLVEVTALEPVHKKHAFLRTAARELRLPNLIPLAERIEDHAGRDYDVATSRATFDLIEWLTRGRELVRPGGAVIGFEGVARDDLPANVERFPYSLGSKQRAIVLQTRST